MALELDLEAIERLAAARGLKLRLRTPRRLGLWTLHTAVAVQRRNGMLQLQGELKGWARPTPAGLHLDTMRVQAEDSCGVGPLIWAASFAWALEATPCRQAWLLAIRDGERQHQLLVRYFRRLGFEAVREMGAGPLDLPGRLVWGGAGLLMRGDCSEGLRRCQRQLDHWAWPDERSGRIGVVPSQAD